MKFKCAACGVESASHAVADRWSFTRGLDFDDGDNVVSNYANNTDEIRLLISFIMACSGIRHY